MGEQAVGRNAPGVKVSALVITHLECRPQISLSTTLAILAESSPSWTAVTFGCDSSLGFCEIGQSETPENGTICSPLVTQSTRSGRR